MDKYVHIQSYTYTCSIHLFNQSFIDFGVQPFYRNRHPCCGMKPRFTFPETNIRLMAEILHQFTYIDMLNIPLFTRFFIHPRWWIYRRISEPTVEHLNHPGWKIMNLGPEFFLSQKTVAPRVFVGKNPSGAFGFLHHLLHFIQRRIHHI